MKKLAFLLVALAGCGEPPEPKPYSVTVYCPFAPPLIVDSVTHVSRYEYAVVVYRERMYTEHNPMCEVRK